MKHERIFLRPEDKNVFLDTYISDPIRELKRKAMLVIPGGAYAFVCSEREGEPIAQAFIPYGFNAFVLSYSVNRVRTFPAQLIEVSMAIRHIKDHAGEYGIDPAQVFVVGFSAGGHLTASVGTLWHLPAVYEAVPMEYGYNKPAGVIPVYPVISSDRKIAHFDSIRNLLGKEEPEEEELFRVSLEKQVDEKTCPMFLVHTAADDLVPVRNSIRMADALAEHHIPFELHIFPDGPHGMALGNRITRYGCDPYDKPEFAKWVALAADWTDRICGLR